MHKLAEKIADCLKAKVEAKGIDNIEGQELVELGMWSDIIKDLVCYDKDKKIIEAMDESEEEMKYIEKYEDYPEMRKGYRGRARDSMGRFKSRRGYDEMMDYHEMYPMEHYRDMDREYGRMYYSGSGSHDGNSMSGSMGSGTRMYEHGMRDHREGRSGMSRRSYMETKEARPGNSIEDKQAKTKELEKYMSELSSDITEMIAGASAEEKTMLKTNMQTLMQKIQ